MRSRFLLYFLWSGLVFSSSAVPAQSCEEVRAAASMARANKVTVLQNARKRAINTYRVDVVFAYRAFQLRPKKAEAERLLALIPKNDGQHTVLMTLGDSLCDKESIRDMRVLGRVYEGLPRELSKAVLMAPRFMPEYTAYSLIAVADPHSDYAVHMREVCRRSKPLFLQAVAKLSPPDRDVFTKHVLNPDKCQVMAIPESTN